MSRFHQSTFAKPENALKRAEELILVGQKQPALQVLHEVITSKRHRTWQKSLEAVMMKYMELCVDMRKGRFAKEGLVQYRIVCQHVNVSSLEEVIKHFLKLATDRADAAIEAAKEVTLSVADLDEDMSPEDLMLSFVTGDTDKDRTDRELVTPCFKFLWETYRTVLEILRNNSKLEALYAMTAVRAFHFCQHYKRTSEFRRLCEILRNHLQNLAKHRDQRDRPDLTNPESLQLYLETRFEQLKVATELGLWQEGFRSVEDIHGLMVFAKKTPKPQMMAVFYAKLTKIFWVSENYLYHAIVWLKLFQLSLAHNTSMTQADLSTMASAVVLSALCIQPFESSAGVNFSEQQGSDRDRHIRVANLLGFQGQYYSGSQDGGMSKAGGAGGSLDRHDHTDTPLTRDAVLAELSSRGVLAHVPESVRRLFSELEEEVSPLELSKRVEPLLESIGSLATASIVTVTDDGESSTEAAAEMSSASPIQQISFAQFFVPVRAVAAFKQLRALSGVYKTMRLDFVHKCVPHFSAIELDSLIVSGVMNGYLSMKTDHKTQSIACGVSSADGGARMQNQLSVLSKRLNEAVSNLPESKKQRAADQQARVAAAISKALATVDEEHSRVLARKVIIERRKEDQERQILEQEKQAEARKLKQQQEREEEERRRQEMEARRRAEERIRREIEEQEAAEAAELLKEREKQLSKDGKKAPKMKEGEVMSKQAIMQAQLSEQIKTRQELERKLERSSKTMDYMERARREEEKPLLDEEQKRRIKEDESYHSEQQAVAAEQHRAQWEADVEVAKKLDKILADKDAILGAIKQRRVEELEAFRAAHLERAAEMKAQREADLIRERKRVYLERLRKAEADYRRREREEQEMREQEERREAETERRRKLDEQAERIRQREAEMDAKKMDERRSVLGSAGAPAPAAGAGGGGRWVPPNRREGGGGARPPSPPRGTGGRWGGDRGEEPPRGDGGGGGGGAYRPPARGGFDDRGDDRRYPPRGDEPRGGGGGGAYRPPARGGFDDRGDDRRYPPRDGDRGGGGGGGYRAPGRGGFDDRDRRDDRGDDRRYPPARRDDRGGGGGGGAYRPPSGR